MCVCVCMYMYMYMHTECSIEEVRTCKVNVL